MNVKSNEYFNELANTIHTNNVLVGWWDDPMECLYQKIQMTSTEVAEATEGARKNLPDDHLEHREMEEVEYADAMIRLLDLGGKLRLKFIDGAVPHRWCKHSASVGKQQLGINMRLCEMARAVEDYEIYQSNVYHYVLDQAYSDALVSIIKVANNRGFALYNAMHEKLEYNANRADHKRENREKENGKKF